MFQKLSKKLKLSDYKILKKAFLEKMAFPFLSRRKILGIDIGTFAIRVVELSQSKEEIKLENYGELQSKFLYEKPFRSFEKNTLSLPIKDIANALRAILKEAKITTRIARFSLPDFSSFFTTFSLPPMSKKELPQAVRFEARHHVPLPISELALDWTIIEGEISSLKREALKILLVAIPQEVVNQYQKIAGFSKLELQNLEAEVFALKRVLLESEEKGVIALVDIGAQSTSCSIIEDGILKMSYSFDISGNDLTKGLVDSLKIEPQIAEKLKLKYGLSFGTQEVSRVLHPLLDLVIIEVEKIIRHFFQQEGKNVEKIILVGGTAKLKGIREYFTQKLEKKVEIGNPFAKISYPKILEKTLNQSAPSFAVALGTALGGFE